MYQSLLESSPPPPKGTLSVKIQVILHAILQCLIYNGTLETLI